MLLTVLVCHPSLESGFSAGSIDFQAKPRFAVGDCFI